MNAQVNCSNWLPSQASFGWNPAWGELKHTTKVLYTPGLSHLVAFQILHHTLKNNVLACLPGLTLDLLRIYNQ